VLSAPPDELAWPPPAGASSYRVRLYRADGDLLWESADLAEPRLDLSSQALDRLAAGHAYFWTVEARGEGLPSRLGPFWFQVAGGR
jgi:hypothetical protein